MVFNSLTYLLLLFLVVFFYWLLPYRTRLFLIFSSSLIFYGFWRIEFIPLLLFSTIVDWWISQKMKSKSDKIRFYLLIISLSVNLGLLIFFKYLIFFCDNAINLANILGAEIDPIFLNIILPLGISFYTFQTISYTVDVYRRSIEPENDFILYACYVTFFPQLVAGPILRAAEVIPQFKNRVKFSIDYISIGIRRIIYGLFLKVVLADNISPLVDSGYSMQLETMSALDVWTLSFLFGFQIYFDFSAYSHIAIGSARLIGISFPENFNFPYLARSPKDFWRCWHISLSSWIRDYLYLPLAGVKIEGKSQGGLALVTEKKSNTKPLFITWAIMGLWHGANWTFVVWGLYHAIIIWIYRISLPISRSFNHIAKTYLGIAITLPLMMLSWIPFRSDSLYTAFNMWSKLFNFSAYTWLGMRENTYLITTFLLISIFVSFISKQKIIPRLKNYPLVLTFIDITMICITFGLVVVFLRPINQFIYFQF